MTVWHYAFDADGRQWCRNRRGHHFRRHDRRGLVRWIYVRRPPSEIRTKLADVYLDYCRRERC